MTNGYATVNPWIISADSAAEIAFLIEVFGAVERGPRFPGPGGEGVGHAEVSIGDTVVMLFDRGREAAPVPSHLRVYVDDVDATLEAAGDAGARVITHPTLLAFGEKVARFADPQGHRWWIHQRVEQVAPEELARRFADPQWQDAMDYVETTLGDELNRR